MEYTINHNNPSVSTTWNFEKVYEGEFSVDELVSILRVVDKFKTKYPKDDIIQTFDEIVRNEICKIFGGHLDE